MLTHADVCLSALHDRPVADIALGSAHALALLRLFSQVKRSKARAVKLAKSEIALGSAHALALLR